MISELQHDHYKPLIVLSKKNTLLWQVKGGNASSCSYLFGTMHVQDLRAFANLEYIKSKIDGCGAFAAEYHLGEHTEGVGQRMSLPAGITLKTLIPEKKYLKLRRIILKSAKLDIGHFIHTSPFMLTGLVGAQLLGKEMPISLDEALWQYAKNTGKELHGIETLEEQLQVLEKIPLDVQVKMLLSLGKKIDRYRRHILHTAALYEQSDLQHLAKSVGRNTGKLRKLLIYKRNEVMAERIAELTKEKSLFVAIGAGHLGGGKGVIRLLKKKGLKLTPIPVGQMETEADA